MKRNLLIFSLVVLSLLLCVGLPIWIGPDLTKYGLVIGLLAEWFCGAIAIVFITVCIYICYGAIYSIWELFDELLSK
jgi:hypothetical protein